MYHTTAQWPRNLLESLKYILPQDSWKKYRVQGLSTDLEYKCVSAVPSPPQSPIEHFGVLPNYNQPRFIALGEMMVLNYILYGDYFLYRSGLEDNVLLTSIYIRAVFTPTS